MSSNPRSPRRTIAISDFLGRGIAYCSNPRSPRRTIAISTIGPSVSSLRFQSSIAPKNDRNDIFSQIPHRSRKRSNPRSPRRTIAIRFCARSPSARDVPILDRPEERSQLISLGSRRNQQNVPILDRPEERSQSRSPLSPNLYPSSNPRSPRRTIAMSNK